MTEAPNPITLADLERERDLLRQAMAEDNSPRDHWPNGRWPMLHRIAQRIDEMRSAAESEV